MKRFLSIFLVVAMIFTNSVVVFAEERKDDTNKVFIQNIEGVEYYHDFNDAYNLVIGKLSNGNIEVSYYDMINDKLYNNIIMMSDISKSQSMSASKTLKESSLYDIITNEVLNGNIKLNVMDIKGNAKSTRSTSSHGSDILDELYNEYNYPTSGTNLHTTDNRDGVPARIDLQTSFSYHEQISVFAGIIGASAGAVAAWARLDVNKVITIALFVYNTSKAVWELATSKDFYKYNVYAYQTKYAYVKDIYQYHSSKTEKFVAVVASGAALVSKYENAEGDFFNDRAIFDAAYATGNY